MEGDAVLEKWIQLIDQELSSKGVPASKRPMYCTNQVLRTALEAPEEVLSADSVFFEIYKKVVAWYKKVYGPEVLSQKEIANFSSFILVNSIPYEISIPRIFTKPDRNPKRIWLIFCERAYPGERTLDYMLDHTVKRALDERSLKTLKSTIDRRVAAYRKIYKALLLCERNIDQSKFVKDVTRHVELAAQGILRDQDRELSLPIWEMFFSVEKCLKLLVADQSTDIPTTHKIDTLLSKLPREIFDKLVTLKFYHSFPHQKAISFRYSEETISDIRIASKYFDMTLEFLVEICKHLKSNIKGKNMKFLVRNDLLDSIEPASAN